LKIEKQNSLQDHTANASIEYDLNDSANKHAIDTQKPINIEKSSIKRTRLIDKSLDNSSILS